MRAFHLEVGPSGSASRNPVAMRVRYVDQYGRVWTAVNPAYTPLDESTARDVGQWFDSMYPQAAYLFGKASDSRGDQRINLLFYDIGMPSVSGLTSPFDLYPPDDAPWPSDRLPMLHIDTRGPQQHLSASSGPSALERIQFVVIHELQHLLYNSHVLDLPSSLSRGQVSRLLWTDPSHIWMTEFLSAAAGRMLLQDIASAITLPQWYHPLASQDDAEAFFLDHKDFLVYPHHPSQLGQSLFKWWGTRDSYAIMGLLADFTLRQGQEQIFLQMRQRWEERQEDTAPEHPVQALALEMGYERFNDFLEDFVLFMVISDHDQPAPVRPAITVGREVKMETGSFLVIKPLEKAYVPPITAMDGLVYIGITLTDNQ